MAYLIQKNTDGTFGHQWPLDDQPLTVGRGEEVTVKIDDPKMSRHHFTVQPRKEIHVIVDQRSTNGTWVNQQKISETELKPDDTIQAGHTTFVYQSGFESMIGQLANKKPSYSTVMRKIAPDNPRADRPRA